MRETETQRMVSIRSGDVCLEGMLDLPEGAQGVVLFAHGSGSGRLSPRNQYVARVLREGGVGTLLLDLLEDWEAQDRHKVFDIDLLAQRLLSATDYLSRDTEARDMAIGYFGASTGAAAALEAAAIRGDQIKAVVSRGGRPDLARDYLPRVTAPTLLIVGGDDLPVIPLNEEAYMLLGSVKQISIIPNATHLFEEPGTLERVAKLAQEWFSKYLRTDCEEEE